MKKQKNNNLNSKNKFFQQKPKKQTPHLSVIDEKAQQNSQYAENSEIMPSLINGVSCIWKRMVAIEKWACKL